MWFELYNLKTKQIAVIYFEPHEVTAIHKAALTMVSADGSYAPNGYPLSARMSAADAIKTIPVSLKLRGPKQQ